MANEEIDPKSANFRTVANKVKSSGADGFFFGITANGGVQLWKDVHAGNPTTKMFGPDGVAEEAFTAELGPAGDVTYVTVRPCRRSSIPRRRRSSTPTSTRSTAPTSPSPMRSMATRP